MPSERRFVEGADYVDNTSACAPFTRVGGDL